MSDTSGAPLTALPDNLPVPDDDGACDHLKMGMAIPSIALEATDGTRVDLAKVPGRVVVFVYPRTGQPGVPLPEGWDDIPGARGCTPQSSRFRDLHAEFVKIGLKVFGLSTQDSAYQRELAERLSLPYPMLSDPTYAFIDALSLPTFTASGMRLAKRVTLVLNEGSIEYVVYPVFPPDKATDALLTSLQNP